MMSIFKFVLLTSLRDKLYWGLFIILALVFALSSFVSYSALSEEAQMQVVYFAFLSRIIIVGGMVLFISFYINRGFENKEIEFILSSPISREQFIVAYLIAFKVIALILFIPIFLIILFFLKYNFFGLMWWSFSVIAEFVLVSIFALTSSLIFKNAVLSILATSTFYFMARMMGFFVYSIGLPQDISSTESWMKIISCIFPRLDLFGKTEWLVYGVQNTQDIYIMIIQSLIYIPLLLFIAFHDFKKREF